MSQLSFVNHSPNFFLRKIFYLSLLTNAVIFLAINGDVTKTLA